MKITIENFSPCIPDEQLRMVLGKKKYKEFIDWMFGQCCPIGGVYTWDLER